MPTKSYRNPPSPKLLEKIGATNLTLADAIAEIVANSFDAAPLDEHLVVEISVGPELVSVVDNGVGMTEEVLVEAVKLGVDMSEVMAKKAGTKGKFGLGMKTACASMGRWWAVYTRPEGSTSEYRVVFDLAEWERRPDSADAWTIDIEEVEAGTRGPLSGRSHGTAVMVRKLRTADPMAGAVLKKLGEAFKPHLEQGDVIKVNGAEAEPHVYHFVPDSMIPVRVMFGPDGWYEITGWVAIDQQTHNDGQYGFNIYRHDQLVQTWNQDWFRGHLMTSRIIGEVHMDFIDATFFKQGLQQSDLWRMASAEMEEFMKPIVRASRDLSRSGNINNPAKRASIVAVMRGEAGVAPPVAPGSSGVVDPPDGGPAVDAGERDLPRLRVDVEGLALENGAHVLLSMVETDMSASGPLFDYLSDDGEPMSLQAVVNTSHPAFAVSKDIDQLRRLAVADSILRCLVDRCGLETRAAVEARNTWLLAAAGATKAAMRKPGDAEVDSEVLVTIPPKPDVGSGR